MNYKFSISGISCNSCIEKITLLLTNQFNATEINFTNNRNTVSFATITPTDIKELNQALSQIGSYNLTYWVDSNSQPSTDNGKQQESYKPIYIIFSYLIGLNLLLGITTQQWGSFMPNFMASFFIVFSFFKLLDLKGFAAGYSSYDLLAKKFYRYGYVYPFLELAFAVGYLLVPYSFYFNLIVFVIMLISSIGVIKAKFSKQKFYCACVGTFLKVPLGTIAIIEDLLMTIMALVMLVQIGYV